MRRTRVTDSTNYTPISNTSYSQELQDLKLHYSVFKNFRDGFFVDVGAHDGIDLNNTLFFEKNFNWKGINIEPIKSVYDRLITNRPNCINLNVAVYNEDKVIDFRENNGYSEMLSGIDACLRKSHIDRIQEEIDRGVSRESTIKKIQANRLETIFKNNNVKHVNYLSIDVEGAEENVIKSINFDDVFIDVIGFEDNYGEQDTIISNIINFLRSKNYVKIPIKCCDIFMINKDSDFFKNIRTTK